MIAAGWVVLKPERVIDPTTNMLALGIPALAVVTLGLSRTGGSWPFIGVVASVVHVLAMSVWIGGVVLLARVVLAGPGEEDLVHAVRGFGRISNPAIIAHGRQRARAALPRGRRRAVHQQVTGSSCC